VEATLHERSREAHPLIVATAGTVHGEQGKALASFLILDEAAARLHHRATRGCPRARFGDIALKLAVDERAAHQGCRNGCHEVLAPDDH
jgi:hypothetical protein